MHELHNDLSCLSERMKIEKFEKLVANLHGKNEYVIHIRNLKQALNHRLVLKTFHRFIKFNQKAWLRSCIGMNTDLRKKVKKWLWERLFEKTIKNVRKHRCQTCNNWSKKESLSMRTKLSHNKIFLGKFISNRNEKNSNSYE